MPIKDEPYQVLVITFDDRAGLVGLWCIDVVVVDWVA